MTLAGYRAEILAVPHDPATTADAVVHHRDGLLVVEDGQVAACGPFADLASRFPSLGVQAFPGKLLVPGSAVFAAGPALHLPIFEGGRLRARFGVSQAALAAAVADYHQAVTDAAHDVAMQALTLQLIQERQRQNAAQVAAKTQLLASARARMQRGLSDAIPVLDAGEMLDRQRDASVQLDAAALAAEIALTRALGGGFGANPPSSSSPGAPSP